MEQKEGIFFLHHSFIKKFIEDDLIELENEITKLFKNLIFSKARNPQQTNLITCDRCMKKVNETHRDIIKSGGAYFDMVKEKSIKEEIEDDDLYSIKVLNDNRISTMGAFFICLEEDKERISELASSKGYTFKVFSPLDFE